MNKKILVPVLAITVIAGGVGGSILNSPVSAEIPNNNSKTEVSEDQDQNQLAKEATISEKEAISAALKEVPGKATETELSNENGTLVYSVEVVDEKGAKQEVGIDAKNGKLLKVEADNEDEGEEGTKEEDDDGEVSDKKEQQQLEKQATVTKEESIAIATKEVKGKVTGTELEDENGTVVYSVEITDDQGKKQEVNIDAKTGKVLKAELDDENEDESESEDGQE